MSKCIRLAAVLGVLVAVAAAPRPADETIDDEGFIREWLLLAPIPLAEGEDAGDANDKPQLPDEAKLAPKEGAKVKVGGKELTWTKQKCDEYFFDFNKMIGTITERSVGYAVTYVSADAEKADVTLKIGSDDGFKLWLNGVEVGKDGAGRAVDKDQDAFPKQTLKAGRNVIVLKVVNDSFEWKGCARFVGKDDKPVKGLTVVGGK